VIPRHIEPHLHSLRRHFPCVVITGVRQCGKTTLLDTLPKGWHRLDMENGADRQQVLADPDLFFRLHPEEVAIDEAQLVPELFPALRVAIDRNRSQKGRFVLTGSSSPQLVRNLAESLAGRVATIELGPLTLTEAWRLDPAPLYSRIAEQCSLQELRAATAPGLSLPQVQEYWFHGGFPEPWLSHDNEFRRLWHHHYLDTYLLRDIAPLFPNLSQDRYRQFVQMLGHLSGTIVNYSEIARTLGISQPTARDYLHIAHHTFLWRHLPAWSQSKHKQLVKHAKGYLRDSGLLHRLLHVGDLAVLATHPQRGHSWEGMVSEVLLRNFHNLGVRFDAYHYRTRGGAEIDLILEGDFGLLPIEIKYAQQSDRRSLRSLVEFIDAHDCPYGLIINNDETPRLLDERILSIPATHL